MKQCFSLFVCLLLVISCKETVFNAGLENRLTAIIDMSPDISAEKVDFTSDEQVGGCNDHDLVFVDKVNDGSSDNHHYTIRIEAKDYFKSENNCNDFSWYWTEQEQVQHQLIINAYVEEITNSMYLESSSFSNHLNYPTSGITAYYKLERDEDGQDNDGQGIEYFGHDVQLEILDLDLENGVMTGTFNATLYRGTEVGDADAFMGVDNFPNLDLYNPLLNDVIEDMDGDGVIDYEYTDSIRIENAIFQRITVINNIPY